MGKISYATNKVTSTAQQKLVISMSLGIIAGVIAWLFSGWQIWSAGRLGCSGISILGVDMAYY